jgi:hypothetical protein
MVTQFELVSHCPLPHIRRLRNGIVRHSFRTPPDGWGKVQPGPRASGGCPSDERQFPVYILESHPRIVKSQDTPILLPWIDLFRTTSILPPLDSPSNHTMARSKKMASIVVALLFLAFAQAGSAMADMVPMSPSASEHVTVGMLRGGVGTTLVAKHECMPCGCCKRSNPSQCVQTSCCTTWNCIPGQCAMVEQTCGRDGCN